MKEDLLNIVWRHFKDILYDLWQAICYQTHGGKQNSDNHECGGGRKIFHICSRLANKHDLNASPG